MGVISTEGTRFTPNDIIQASRIARESQRFFLNQREIPGVQSIQGQGDLNLVPVAHLGMTKLPVQPNNPRQGTFSLNAAVIDSDYFLPFTGQGGFNGYVLRSRTNTANNFSFASGYLTSYNSKCAIGQIPETSVSVAVYGNVGNLTIAENSTVSGDFGAIAAGTTAYNLQVGSYGAMDISLNDFSTNRLLSYDLGINIARNPIYALGSPNPVDVQINWPSCHV